VAKVKLVGKIRGALIFQMGHNLLAKLNYYLSAKELYHAPFYSDQHAQSSSLVLWMKMAVYLNCSVLKTCTRHICCTDKNDCMPTAYSISCRMWKQTKITVLSLE